MAGRIRVLVVDDSVFFRAAIIRALSADPGIDVVGEAYDPYDARDKILELSPDMMTLDIEMPYMNGVEFLKVLLPQWPIPVLSVSSAVHRAPDALQAGARDFLPKPTDRSPDGMQKFSEELRRRIHKIAENTRNSQYRVPLPQTQTAAVGEGQFEGFIALGASTGGTQSTAKILRAMPRDMNGFVIVQHMPPDFTRMYAENLDRDCAMTVREANDGDYIEQGVVLIAPGGDRQCEVVRRGGRFCLHLYHGEKVNGHCPSVDVLFSSVAKCATGKDAVGVILTGMGADGARGLLAMRKKGCYTVGQDEKSSIVYGMPREAYEMGAVCRQAELGGIASLLLRYVKEMRK
ncbi:MAG: chemotaxis response regulator protein-glutamate methylesterase [Oscillospiraceae bacterium]|jgi:two-component system chemotaxis response regulator CheB|nr:chemotaxis response regulator protein-glutamate methylesterase [Oscillospiraceae bacterium]